MVIVGLMFLGPTTTVEYNEYRIVINDKVTGRLVMPLKPLSIKYMHTNNNMNNTLNERQNKIS